MADELGHSTLIGRPAPPFELDAVSIESKGPFRISRSTYAGRWLMLVFYPRDFSFVCPTELTAFSAHIDAFRARGCEIVGVSVDSVDDHRRWFDTPVDRGGIGPLQFPLAADPGGDVSRAYGVWLEAHGCSARGLFIIDPAGILQYVVVHNASVGRNADETLRVLDALRSGGLCPASWTEADGTIDAESQLQAGRVLGHFRIVNKLGAGAFGSVLAADDLKLNRRVAIKIIGRHANIARDQALAEARSAATLHHPNICTVFAVDTIDAVPVIVMEYIDGVPLSQFPIAAADFRTRWRIAREIAEGLAYAHAHGVVHGDLKPANIMIAADHRAKLLDFGLANRRETGLLIPATPDSVPSVDPQSAELAETVITDVGLSDSAEQPGLRGTPAYMSPEQTRGRPPSTASDVFAFGLILCELLSGQPAVQAEDLIGALEEIRSGTVRERCVAAVSEPYREVVGALLADDSGERPAISNLLEFLSREVAGENR